jgi:hypothetical protein
MTFTYFLNLRKIWSKVIFCKDNFYVWFQKKLSESRFYDFHVFFKFKKNLDKDNFESEVVFSKTIFTRKIIFFKDDFKFVHFSNKLQKSHVWPKNIKKSFFFFFLTSLAEWYAICWSYKIKICGLAESGEMRI